MKTNFENLAHSIESDVFRFNINIATGYRMFKVLLQQQTEFSDLIMFVYIEIGGVEVQKRLQELMSIEVNPKYGHPYDVAMSTYLSALRFALDVDVYTVAEKIAEAENLWWTRHVAQEILRERDLKQIHEEFFKTLTYGNVETITENIAYKTATNSESYGILTNTNIKNSTKTIKISVSPTAIYKEAS